MEDKLIRINDVLMLLSIKKTFLYSLIKTEPLLKPIKIGSSSLWSYNNVQEYIKSLKLK